MHHTVAYYIHTHTIDHSCCFFNLPCIIHDAVDDDITREEGGHEVHRTLEGVGTDARLSQAYVPR